MAMGVISDVATFAEAGNNDNIAIEEGDRRKQHGGK
jgi:hypothetical protein